jgi:type IV fimbrial biogenesis protein FimT
MGLAESRLAMIARRTLLPGTPAGGCGPRNAPSWSAGARGFTLIELMVVVLIITVVAGLAAPSAVVQMKERRVQEAARQIAILYREARLQAVGTGAATLLRYSGGTFQVREAVAGPLAPCPNAPVPSCNIPWIGQPALSRQTASYAAVASGGDLSSLALSVTNGSGGALPEFEVCFSPNGRAFSRAILNDGTPLLPLNETITGTLRRPGMGRSRSVVLLPNGTARLSAE